MSLPPAQDPDELFDIVTADGEPTGHARRRADVHRDGDWHRAIHIWVWGVEDSQAGGPGDGEPFLILQQRGMMKDTNPGMLDPTVSGHLGAGEGVEDAYREMEEEIGITAEPSLLHHVGTRPRAAEHTTPGVIDRELQEVFLYRDDRPLGDYRPNPAEVDALVRVSVADAIALFAGERERIPADHLDARAGTVSRGEIDTTMFHARMIDRYYLRAVLAIQRDHRGEAYNVL
jgi:isopentenyldiphosphate isomerase